MIISYFNDLYCVSKIRKLLRENISKDLTGWLINLSSIDSTNNYAMQMIQDGLAYHGLVVAAEEQYAGKGQRGKIWNSQPGANVMMSLIIEPPLFFDIYSLSFALPVAVHKALQNIVPECQLHIKWPNDIYVYDKKLAGILIENVFRGSQIKHSVIGIGVNVNQEKFEIMDRMPTSLLIETKETYNRLDIVAAIRNEILNLINSEAIDWMRSYYNEHLWKVNEQLKIIDKERDKTVRVVKVNDQFQLVVVDEKKENIITYDYGTIQIIG